MAQLTGSNKINIAVFISGTGSNLKSLIKFSKLKKSPIIIKLIISNNYKAKLELAVNFLISTMLPNATDPRVVTFFIPLLFSLTMLISYP